MKAEFQEYTLEFLDAFGYVTKSGECADWLINDADEQCIEIELIREGERIRTNVKTKGVSSIRENYIEKMTDDVFDPQSLFEYLQSLVKSNEAYNYETIRGAFSVDEYPWGQLFSFDWTSLGYAPGGVGYFLQPTGEGVMFTTGRLKLGWSNVKFQAKGV